jgi:hypothetical protein
MLGIPELGLTAVFSCIAMPISIDRMHILFEDCKCKLLTQEVHHMTQRTEWPTIPPVMTDRKHRFFALVISVPLDEADRFGLGASTDIGNMAREAAPSFLPAGSRITRSIEITEKLATEAW